jgi:protein SCO1
MKRLWIILLAAALVGCEDPLPQKEFIGDEKFELIDQNGDAVVFPNDFEGEITLVGFVFTNCPDICPMTTHSMQMLQEALEKEGIDGVRFATITFDPERDTPEVFREYIRVRGIDDENWAFLSGAAPTTEKLMDKMSIVAVSSDTTVTEEGDLIYFFTHTDRITLVDPEMNIRNEYIGSRADIRLIVEDVKKLADD